MASDFDELVRTLQYELALAGKDGISYQELKAKVHDFYTEQNETSQAQSQTQPADLLFSEEAPATITVVSEQLVESVWHELSKLKGIHVDQTDTTHEDDSHSGERLVASIEQIWQAIAGHNVDNTRIKGYEFPLLHIIAKHGRTGIAQPDLVKITGQDKRSVPQRTDRLAKNGYIVKIPAIAGGAKTSLLKLKRFADNVEDQSKEVDIPDNARVIYYDQWFDNTMRMLKEHKNVMAMDDIRTELGIVRHELHSRAFQRCIRRLELGGCVRRIKARVAGKLQGERGEYARALQLLREPTEDDRGTFMMKPKDQSLRHKMSLLRQQPDQKGDGQEDEDIDDDDAMDVVDTVELNSRTSTVVPQWTKDLTLPRFIYDLVELAGSDGLSIMDLHKRGTGQVYRRAMDEQLVRLCDSWQTSQPSHLRHLTIVKDTGAIDKYTFFKYRTYENFQQAVNKGDAFWEAVAARPVPGNKASRPKIITQPLDQYGFPILPKMRFAGRRDGAASLTQASKAAISSLTSRKGNLWSLHAGHPFGRPPNSLLKRKATDLIDGTPPNKVLRRAGAVSSVQPSCKSPAGDRPTLFSQSSVAALATRQAFIDDPRAVSHRALSWPNRKGRKPKFRMLTIKSSRLHDFSWFAVQHTHQSRSLNDSARNVSASQDNTQSMLPSTRQSIINTHNVPAHGRIESLPSGSARSVIDLSMSARSPAATSDALQRQLDSGITFSPSIDGTPRSHRKKQGISRGEGAIKMKRTQIIMDVLRRCGGLYPGDKEIHIPVSAGAKQLNGAMSDSNTVAKAIKELITRGKLRKLAFQFHDSKGNQVTKHILTDLTVDPSDPRIRELQQKVQEVFPSKYHPPEAGVTAQVLAEVDNRPEKRFPPPIKLDSDNQVVDTSADIDNEPVRKSYKVKRTPAGLEHDQERHLTNQRASVASSDGDGDLMDTEQSKLSHRFQVTDYVHNDEHAFEQRKSHARFASRSTSTTFFAPPQFDPTSPAFITGFRARPQAVAKPIIKVTSHKVISQARSNVLMMEPGLTLHEASGTFNPAAVVSAPMESSMVKQLEQGNRKAPVTRLQSLGSSLLSRRLYSKPQPVQVSNPARLAELETARALALGQKRPITEVIDNDEDDDESDGSDQEFVPQLPPKKKPRPYKSLRGAKSSLGVDSAERNETGIEILEQDDPRLQGPSYAVTRKRDRKGTQQFKEVDRLTGAVALYRVVMGAMDQRNNWGVIAHMLGFRYEPDFLRRRWDLVKSGREEAVRGIMEQLYDLFLDAYEDDKLPTIDFDNLNTVDWPAYMDWYEAQAHLATVIRPVGIPQLPGSKTGFEKMFSVTESPSFWEHSKEIWFTSLVEKSRKDLAHEFIYGVALPGHIRPTSSFVDDKVVQRSIIRAISLTKDEKYRPDQAAALLSRFPNDEVSATCEELVTEKTLRHLNKGRQRPGRNYEIHDAHWALFRRWPGKLNEWQYVRDIAAARQSILQRFEASDRVYLDYHASDFEIIVFTNMADQGLVRIVTDLPERNDDFDAPFPKISAMGYSDYTYNAKTLDRERLRFPVVYERTSRYHDMHGLIAGLPIPSTPRVNDGRVPFWLDIYGEIMPDVWDLVLRSILHLIVFRPGCTVKMMEQSHYNRFLEWEITPVIDWLERSGVAVRCGEGREVDGVWQGGWTASEWWYCAFEPEMAYWKSV